MVSCPQVQGLPCEEEDVNTRQIECLIRLIKTTTTIQNYFCSNHFTKRRILNEAFDEDDELTVDLVVSDFLILLIYLA